ncbi:unnamed protein product [Echinostoma caproni]|uniref:Peptidase_M13_N domain-containing protein n=1 Tax=Echinostoma caproni TaxID=27848 RepID=A0A183AIT0_9TREM|nr:unnamed protein product [Echinostoma caproni]
MLWALVSIFVETSDDLRSYLFRYTQSVDVKGNKKIGASIDTVNRSMELVAKHGPRKYLPPDNALKLLVAGDLHHRQQVNLPNKTCLLATVGQLSLVRDAIRGLVDQLNPHTSKISRDFSLYLAPISSNAATYEDKPLIPLNMDDYLLDFPVYDQTYALYFRRLCWTVKMDYNQIAKTMLNSLFDQVSEEYLSGYWLPQANPGSADKLNNECASISCLLYQGRDETGPINSSAAFALMPKTLEADADRWRIKMNESLTVLKCSSASEARSNFLSKFGF